MNRPNRRLAVAALLGMTVGGGACGLRSDEFQCERAVTHLDTCCEGLELDDACDYQTSFFGLASIPVLTVSEAACVLSKPCAALEDLCDPIQARLEDTGLSADSGTGWQPLPECR